MTLAAWPRPARANSRSGIACWRAAQWGGHSWTRVGTGGQDGQCCGVERPPLKKVAYHCVSKVAGGPVKRWYVGVTRPRGGTSGSIDGGTGMSHHAWWVMPLA
jgi:hypothetical protein